MKYIVLFAVLFLVACSTAPEMIEPEDNSEDVVSNQMPALNDSSVNEMVVNNESNEEADVVLDMTGGNFYFEMNGEKNPTITVKEGEVITINFKAVEGFHDVVIDELNAATEKIKAGETSSVTFTANRKGTFEYYCSVGSHREQGMFGTFIVE